MLLEDWIEKNAVSENMLWRDAFYFQINKIRDLVAVVNTGLPYSKWHHGEVISTHVSKSITLPVVKLVRGDLQLIMRDNFHNLKLSVISPEPIQGDFSYLFYTTPPPDREYTGDSMSPIYFEGFPSELVFGYYSKNPARWSADIPTSTVLEMVVRMILRSLKMMPDLKWPTRSSNP